MRILFLTQYYPPETGAAQNRLGDLAERLREMGHELTVLTAMPNYPAGEIYPGYRSRFWRTESVRGVRTLRTWIYATKSKGFITRILNYLSFAFFAFLRGLMMTEKVDVIFAESPPLFAGFCGYGLSRIKNARFVLNISDLWPESAVALGILRNRTLIRFVTQAEEWLYRQAALVTGQTQGIINSICERCPGTRTMLMTNGVSPEFLDSTAAATASREKTCTELGVSKKFVAGYAGLHGLVYRLDLMLDAARALQTFAEIHFLLLGDGPEKGRLEEKARIDGLKNVTFRPTLPAHRMPEVFTTFDVIVIPLRRHDLFKGTLPSKLFEALGAGVPVVGAFEGEAQRLIEAANCGICVEPEDSCAMAEAILTLYKDPQLRRKLGDNGREYVAKHYNRQVIAKRFEQLVAAVGALQHEQTA